jgi:hypothetical protein
VQRLLVSLSIGLSVCGVAAPLIAQPAVQSRDGELAIVAGEHGPRVIDDRGYSNPLSIPEEVAVNSLAAIRAGWVAAGTQPVGVRSELYLRMLDAGGLKRLPNPHSQQGRLRAEPVILSRAGAVEGLLWLEGEGRESLRVFFSVWLGITWSEPQPVGIDPPGGALALDAARLADGSWLVAWAGFDGEDDEIYWSLVIEGSATEPVALTDNDVPDVLPSVTAAGPDALLAWNHFDGEEYRVLVTRMSEGRWTEPRAEPRGTFEPVLLERDGVPTLLYFSYRGGEASWNLAELDPEGRALRRSSTAALGRDRPVVRPIDGEPHLQWPTRGDRRRVEWVDER